MHRFALVLLRPTAGTSTTLLKTSTMVYRRRQFCPCSRQTYVRTTILLLLRTPSITKLVFGMTFNSIWGSLLGLLVQTADKRFWNEQHVLTNISSASNTWSEKLKLGQHGYAMLKMGFCESQSLGMGLLASKYRLLVIFYYRLLVSFLPSFGQLTSWRLTSVLRVGM